MTSKTNALSVLEQEAKEGYLTSKIPLIVRDYLARKPECFGDEWEMRELKRACAENLFYAEGRQRSAKDENIKRKKFNQPPLHVYDQQDFDHDKDCVKVLGELQIIMATTLKRPGLSFCERLWKKLWVPIDWDLVYRTYAENKAREMVLAECVTWTPRQFILAFRSKCVEDAREAAIGPESLFAKEKNATSLFLDQLNSVHSRLQIMAEAYPNDDLLSHVGAEVKGKIAQVRPAYEKMCIFEREVVVFAENQLAKIELLKDPLNKLEIIREANALCQMAEDVVSGTEASITTSLLTLKSDFERMNEQVALAYEEFGIALAVEASGQNATFNIQRLDQIIAQHVPARLELVKQAS